MAKPSLALFTFIFACFLLSNTISAASFGVDEDTERSWCIAKPSTDDDQLDKNAIYCCTQAEVDCSSIKAGGLCYEPKNKVSSASVVMNLYYHKQNRAEHSCDFNGSALIVYHDPSVGSCQYPGN